MSRSARIFAPTPMPGQGPVVDASYATMVRCPHDSPPLLPLQEQLYARHGGAFLITRSKNDNTVVYAPPSADPVKAWKAFETLQHPTLSSSILPEDIEVAMARALKRTANLFSSRQSANYAGSSGAAASESGGGSKRG